MEETDLFELTEQQVSCFTETFVLLHMAEEDLSYDILLEPNDACLQNTLLYLQSRKLIEINKKHFYEITEQGREVAEEFKHRYGQTLTYLDIFAHVDLAAGDFAYSHYPNINSQEEWDALRQKDNWEDMRVAILDHLDGDPLELIFAQFVVEQRIDTEQIGWQEELVHGHFWQDIVDIANSAIDDQDLNFDDEETGERIPGTYILDQIVDKGFEEMRRLYPNDTEIQSHLNSWYPEESVSAYGAAVPTKGSERPVWETPWAL